MVVEETNQMNLLVDNLRSILLLIIETLLAIESISMQNAKYEI